MTLKKAEKITGCVIHVLSSDDTYTAEAVEDGRTIASAHGKKLKKVLDQLVASVYSIRAERARVASGFRCKYCGKIVPLQTHHRVHRARGQRDDRVENLDVLCHECHHRCHS